MAYINKRKRAKTPFWKSASMLSLMKSLGYVPVEIGLGDGWWLQVWGPKALYGPPNHTSVPSTC